MATTTSDDAYRVEHGWTPATVIHGECLAAMRDMDPETVDLVLTDPPYGMGYRSNMRIARERFDAIANDAEFDPAFQLAWLRECYRLLKPDTHIYVFCSDHHLGEFRETVKAAGFNVKRCLVWCKGGGGMGDLAGDYAHETEFVVFAHKGNRPLTGKRISNVLNVPKVRPADMQHPTEKPAGVVRRLIQKSCQEGGVVLDPFGGSGVVAVAASEEGRGYIVIEQEETYIGVIEARLAQGGLF